MENSEITENEIKSWLSSFCEKEDLKIIDLEIVGTSGQGEGQCGEIIFVNLKTTTNNLQSYNLALKSSKSNTAIMTQSPTIRLAFKNEIHFYEKILPTFKQFEIQKQIQTPFESIPKYYGSYSDETKDIIFLENLKMNGFEMWNPCKPLTKNHIDIVVDKYAHFHAISIAMQEFEAIKFQELTAGINTEVYDKFFKNYSSEIVYKNNIDYLHDLLKSDFDEEVLQTWLKFKNEIHYICFNLKPEENELKVITHGDCWNNNFLYKYQDKKRVSEVAIIDWQISRISSPITDLSYFLFACISEDDLNNLQEILKNYFEIFSGYLVQLGSSLIKNYSFEKFLKEWKKFSKFGLMMAVTLLKACYTRGRTKEDLSIFKINYKNRMKCVVKHAVENLII